MEDAYLNDATVKDGNVASMLAKEQVISRTVVHGTDDDGDSTKLMTYFLVEVCKLNTGMNEVLSKSLLHADCRTTATQRALRACARAHTHTRHTRDTHTLFASLSVLFPHTVPRPCTRRLSVNKGRSTIS